MDSETLLSSPFALMLAPEDVFRALQASESLNRLQSRICRPLDKPTPIVVKNAMNVEIAQDSRFDDYGVL